MKPTRTLYERRSADEWRELIDQQEQSGEFTTSFAARNGLALSTYQRWKQRLRNVDAEIDANSSFVPIAFTADSMCELSLPDGQVLRFPSSLPAQTLRCWLEVLESR